MRATVLICLIFALLAQVSQAADQDEWLCNPKAAVIAVPCVLGGLVLILGLVTVALALKVQKMKQQLDQRSYQQPKTVEIVQSYGQPGQVAPVQYGGQMV